MPTSHGRIPPSIWSLSLAPRLDRYMVPLHIYTVVRVVTRYKMNLRTQTKDIYKSYGAGWHINNQSLGKSLGAFIPATRIAIFNVILRPTPARPHVNVSRREVWGTYPLYTHPPMDLIETRTRSNPLGQNSPHSP